MKRTQTILMTTVILSIALTSVFAINYETNNTTTMGESIPFAYAGVVSTHSLTMEAVKMPDGMYAYRMVEYRIDGGDDLVGVKYSHKPSIPGPTIMLTEGDTANVTLINSACDENFIDGPTHPAGALPTYSETSLLGIHVHGVHYDISDDATYARVNMDNSSGAECGSTVSYTWTASPGTAGAWPYHDHTFSINEIGAEELGLFGTVIVNPQDGMVNGLVNEYTGEIEKVPVDEIEKEFVLWMVSSEVLGRSIFYGNEIDMYTTDYDGNEDTWRETALWTNPNLVTKEGGKYRFHVIGLGEETHAFHLHGHRWTEEIHQDADVEDVIDVKEITPLQRHTFIIEASSNGETADDSEGWMYHCHFVDHMKQGMSGMMTVLESGQDDDLPEVGAVFMLSDEPGLWMKTLNAGIADDLDEYLASLGLIEPRAGTGFPLGYISDALETAVGGGTDFSNSEGRSLAVINPGETVLFGMKDSQTKHTITTLIYPDEATPLGGNGILRAPAVDVGHFDTQLGIRGSTFLTDSDGIPQGLDTPGLYVFVCKIHPYMFSAVIVDDPGTKLLIGGDTNTPFPLLDLSDGLTVLTRTDSFPTVGLSPADPLAKSLLTTFYVITDPNNWRDYDESHWNVRLPPVLVTTDSEDFVVGLAYDEATTQIAAGLLRLTKSDTNAPATITGIKVGVFDVPNILENPTTSGVGEVLVNTQFERTLNKNFDGTSFDKPGTITVVDVDEWKVDRKFALPEINMNHPHNMWTDVTNEKIYQTEWFGSEMAVIDRESGKLLKEVYAGQSPSHVMTSPDNEKIYIAVNGEETVNEFDPETYEMTRQISTGFRSHPHGHWISSSGNYIVTPDFIGLKASIIDLSSNPITVHSSDDILLGPIATGMKSDDSEFFTADFLGNSNTAIDVSTGIIDPLRTIDWVGDYGVGLPIQTPISPDDRWMVTALTLGGKVGVVDVFKDPPEVQPLLDCDPGCHGVQWGAKEGGGYYAYVTSKFSNSLTVVDPDPDGDVDTHDAAVVGRILLKDRGADNDDPIIGYDGMGGQGVLAIPNVYDGWIQNTVSEVGTKSCDKPGPPQAKGKGPCNDIENYLDQLTPNQKNP